MPEVSGVDRASAPPRTAPAAVHAVRVADTRHPFATPAALELIGWMLFLAGCLLFLGSAIGDGDIVTIAGSALFLLGVVAFLAARQ